MSFWPVGAQLVPILLLTTSGLFVWGLVSVVGAWRATRVAIAAFVGTVASIAGLVLIAVSATPLGCIAYIAAVSLCGIAGLAAGVLSGLAVRRREVE
jgi:hypothetical protein